MAACHSSQVAKLGSAEERDPDTFQRMDPLPQYAVPGRTRLATRYPERVIGELDMEIGRQRMNGAWWVRSDAVCLAMERFFTAHSLLTVDPSVVEAATSGPRRSMSIHIDDELGVRMRTEIVAAGEAGSMWVQWEVVAVSVRYFLDSGGFQPRAQA